MLFTPGRSIPLEGNPPKPANSASGIVGQGRASLNSTNGVLGKDLDTKSFNCGPVRKILGSIDSEGGVLGRVN
jgi:hypothetical protein